MAANKTTVELVNIDKCLDAFDGSRFRLILAAAARAREIANKNTIADKDSKSSKHVHKPTVDALLEIADGKIGKEYLNKIR